MSLFDDLIVSGNRAVCRSFAKINLTLDVTGVRENGYHDVKMIMQTVNLSDLIIVDKRRNGIYIKSNLEYIPTDERNIAYKAAQLFFEKSGISGGASILLKKSIPVAAGLAGGSGNGGAVLCALNKLYDFPFTEEEIIEMSVTLGADVPYSIMCATALAEGIGEELTRLPDCPKMTVLLVKPPINISTPETYKAYDALESHSHPDTDAMISAIASGDIRKIAENLSNTLEDVTAKNHPVISGIKEKMIKNGALNALMSGSGPTVFGIFEDEAQAKKSADSFYKQYREVYLCKTIN